MSDWQYAVPKEQGVHHVVHEGNSELSVLSLDGYRLRGGDVEEIHFADRESIFFVVEGTVQADIDGESHSLGPYDMAYVPVGATARVRVLSQSCLAAMPMAKTTTVKDPFVVHYAKALAEPRRNEVHGSLSFSRNVFQYCGIDDETARIFAGSTTSQHGSWSAWPPHEHQSTFEEIYFYFGMNPEGFAVHLFLTDDYKDEKAYVVRNGAVLTVPAAYHPMVASPGNRARYLYVMGSKDEEKYKPSSYREAANVHAAFKTHTFQL
jgi:5-deoxy-glucuronate isomerase